MPCFADPLSDRKFWTHDPYELLRNNTPALEELRRYMTYRAKCGRPLTTWQVGDAVWRITGIKDCAFYQVPVTGKVAIVQVRRIRVSDSLCQLSTPRSATRTPQALCPLYDQTLADGDVSKSTTFIQEHARISGVTLVWDNISMTCFRKGSPSGQEDAVSLPNPSYLWVWCGVVWVRSPG